MPHLGADGTIGDVGGLVGGLVDEVIVELVVEEQRSGLGPGVQPGDDFRHHGIVLFMGRNCVIGW